MDNRFFPDKNSQHVGQLALLKLPKISAYHLIATARATLKDKRESDIKQQSFDGENYYSSKVFFSLGTYFIYDYAKFAYRESFLDTLESQLIKQQITVQQAVVEILTSFVGENDLYSFKFLLINKLFNIGADSHKRAKDIINEIIIACQSDIDIPLQQYGRQ